MKHLRSAIMINMRRIVEGLLIALAASAATPVMSDVAPADRLAATVDFFGARIGMTRNELMMHTPATVIPGDRCTSAPSDDPKLIFLECGIHKLTVDLTAAGTIWQLRASYDFTDTSLSIADADAALVGRDGKADSTPGGGLAWLVPGTPAAKVNSCAAGAMLLAAQIDKAGRPGAPADPLPTLDPHCAPVRTAILAEKSGHRGVIVDVQDARPRLAELRRQRGERASDKR